MRRSDATWLTVVRHGQTPWNADRRSQGHLDSGLSALGVRQARVAAEALAGCRFDALYSSDLGRALQTAEIIARRLGLEVRTDSRLRERHMGILQGHTIDEFCRTHPDECAAHLADDPDHVIPEGESMRQRYERNMACAADIVRHHGGADVIIVTHGGVLDSFIRHTLGLELREERRFSLCNASINTFSVSDGQWRLECWGDTRHLAGLEENND